ncbi:oligosaccharide flippase family protein [Corynebacterium callunae]|uniref:oligosaccharide flippase family protein n=1 Tax=Corynebacterium callunae TaxID=1721 RepID=UPI0039820CB3
MKIPVKFRVSGTSKSIATLVTGNSLAQLVNIVGIPILSRIYDPIAIGLLAIYVSVASIFSVLASGRYELAIVLPDSTTEAIKIKALAQWISLAVSTVACLLLVLLMGPISSLLGLQEYRQWLPGISALVLLSGVTNIMNYWYTRQKKFKIQSINKVILSASVLFFQVLFGILLSNSVTSLLLGLILGQSVAVIFLVSQQELKIKQQMIDIEEAKSLSRKYVKMPLVNGPNALLDSVRMNGLNFVIASISASSLGQFSMALRGVQAPVGLFSQALSQVFLQKMARESQGELYPMVVTIIRKGLILAFIPFLIVFLVSPKIFPFLLGPGWELSGYFAQALVPWLYLNVVSSPLANIFIVTQTQGRLLLFAFFYMLTPLIVVHLLRSDILMAVWGLGLSMAILLLIQIGLALITAKRSDRKLKITI